MLRCWVSVCAAPVQSGEVLQLGRNAAGGLRSSAGVCSLSCEGCNCSGADGGQARGRKPSACVQSAGVQRGRAVPLCCHHLPVARGTLRGLHCWQAVSTHVEPRAPRFSRRLLNTSPFFRFLPHLSQQNISSAGSKEQEMRFRGSSNARIHGEDEQAAPAGQPRPAAPPLTLICMVCRCLRLCRADGRAGRSSTAAPQNRDATSPCFSLQPPAGRVLGIRSAGVLLMATVQCRCGAGACLEVGWGSSSRGSSSASVSSCPLCWCGAATHL